jgi:hypothetical protein
MSYANMLLVCNTTETAYVIEKLGSLTINVFGKTRGLTDNPCRREEDRRPSLHPAPKGLGDYVVTINQATSQPRWATRKEAIQYSKIGATKFSELIRDRRIVAKRLDARKLIIDLNSIDQLYECLPDGAPG